MHYDEVIKYLAPCGLDCNRCAGYEQGEIRQLSLKLIELLGGYRRLAKLRAETDPEFVGYPQFEEVLAALSQSACGGCRSDNSQCPITCALKVCHKEKNVDFCFQCVDYPCEKQPGFLRKIWKKNNDRMKEIGVVEFYYEQFKLPRY
jgi:hypothetical protein